MPFYMYERRISFLHRALQQIKYCSGEYDLRQEQSKKRTNENDNVAQRVLSEMAQFIPRLEEANEKVSGIDLRQT